MHVYSVAVQSLCFRFLKSKMNMLQQHDGMTEQLSKCPVAVCMSAIAIKNEQHAHALCLKRLQHSHSDRPPPMLVAASLV